MVPAGGVAESGRHATHVRAREEEEQGQWEQALEGEDGLLGSDKKSTKLWRLWLDLQPSIPEPGAIICLSSAAWTLRMGRATAKAGGCVQLFYDNYFYCYCYSH